MTLVKAAGITSAAAKNIKAVVFKSLIVSASFLKKSGGRDSDGDAASNYRDPDLQARAERCSCMFSSKGERYFSKTLISVCEEGAHCAQTQML